MGLFSFSTVDETKTQRCQKCLELGHWTYECKGERKYPIIIYRVLEEINKHKRGINWQGIIMSIYG